MSDQLSVEKLRQHLRDEGIRGTAEAVTERLRKTVAGTLEGSPGYYSLRLQLLRRRYDSEVLTPVWISPDEITFLTGEYERRESGHLDYVPYFKPREARWESLPYEAEVGYGTVQGGSWDQLRVPFSKLLMYRGIKQRFEEDYEWSETIYYNELLSRFDTRGLSKKEAKRLAMGRCDRIEKMYETISSEGYRSQQAVNGNPLHEVTVNVAQDGEVMYNCEGRHRLSIAKILGIDRIPVLVLVRHSEFEGDIIDA